MKTIILKCVTHVLIDNHIIIKKQNILSVFYSKHLDFRHIYLTSSYYLKKKYFGFNI